MACGRDTLRRNPRHRSGLSFVEFIGCMFALSSGLAMGSVYLGVDLKTMCVGILEQAELVDPGFFGSVAAADQIEEDPYLSHRRGGGQSTDDGAADEPDREWTYEEQKAATELYWQGLTASIRADVAHRKLDSRGAKKWRLFDYLSHRREGHENILHAIELLQRAGVDQNLLAHSDQVFDWHLTGADVYNEAVELLTDSPSEQLSGPLAEQWRNSATQHRMEEKLVREKHAAVTGYLNHAFEDAGQFRRAF
jgi:hypothetical protein